MTLAELIALYRAQAQDEAAPYLCSDALLSTYANEAQDEACRRSQVVRDSHSPLSAIAYEAGATALKLDARILHCERAHVDGHRLAVVPAHVMDDLHPGWPHDARTAVRPTHLVVGLSTGHLHLWPLPEQAGTVRLTVHRLPRRMLDDGEDAPELPAHTHRALVDWMLYRAYSRADTELHDAGLAAAALARFEAEFGPKVSARNTAWHLAAEAALPGPIA